MWGVEACEAHLSQRIFSCSRAMRLLSGSGEEVALKSDRSEDFKWREDRNGCMQRE